jgi:hypothetical protein
MDVQWPNGYRFAFTVVDDTDWATLDNVKPVYDLLAGLGMRTTKTTWMFSGNARGHNSGETCEDLPYRDWLLALQSQGFEIALHNAAPSTSDRQATQTALDSFQQLFRAENILFCNHTGCQDNIYWGAARLSGWHQRLYNLATKGKRRNISRGHIVGDPLFWGDLCRQHVRYVRNFVFDELDMLRICPELPYHDPSRPFVNFWFPSANGANLKRFLENFTLTKLDALAEVGGLCIAYVHFAAGFAENGAVNHEFRRRMEHLASLGGWFAPASDLLEFLRAGASKDERIISPRRLAQLECKWLFEKLLKGTS